MTGNPILVIDSVRRMFGGVTALDGVSFSVDRGEIVGLIGPNGAGKTTLVNVVSGAEQASSGTVCFAGSVRASSLEKCVDQGIVRTFQTPRAFFGLTLAENLRVAKASPSARTSKPMIPSSLWNSLERSMDEWMNSKVSDLPFGVVRQLSIALALCTNPTLLLLDEPCVGLTMPEVDELSSTIKQLRDNGLTVLLIEHNVPFVMELVDRVVVMHKGSVLFEGGPDACRDSQAVQDVYLGTNA